MIGMGHAVTHSLTCDRPDCQTLKLPAGQMHAACGKCGKTITHGTINTAVTGARST